MWYLSKETNTCNKPFSVDGRKGEGKGKEREQRTEGGREENHREEGGGGGQEVDRSLPGFV